MSAVSAFDGAEANVEEGWQLAKRIDERVGLPNLLLMRGRIAGERGNGSGA